MSDFEQEFNEVVGETQCLLELDEVDARMIFNAGVKAAKQSMQGVIAELQAQVEELREDAVAPRLTVKICSFPESNGKRNWTAQLVRIGEFDGLIGTAGGITLAHSELWNRVAYEAERTRFLLGERDTEPHILDYGDDIKTPEEWEGETRLRHLNVNDAAISKGGE